jgi:hypothetical protein
MQCVVITGSRDQLVELVGRPELLLVPPTARQLDDGDWQVVAYLDEALTAGLRDEGFQVRVAKDAATLEAQWATAREQVGNGGGGDGLPDSY